MAITLPKISAPNIRVNAGKISMPSIKMVTAPKIGYPQGQLGRSSKITVKLK